ncbi:hypothetical protein RhiirC2_491680 [Rhizophagus irregularis]|uniref:Uncharacterized protein n=1 Tax=Rhizophagus irregularis TaxID=588596 RepID=A0A2N1P3D0_9GLOM|nr:hypothetical protein RhiirC2_491680 [Rhizophagus irregularis]
MRILRWVNQPREIFISHGFCSRGYEEVFSFTRTIYNIYILLYSRRLHILLFTRITNSFIHADYIFFYSRRLQILLFTQIIYSFIHADYIFFYSRGLRITTYSFIHADCKLRHIDMTFFLYTKSILNLY